LTDEENLTLVEMNKLSDAKMIETSDSSYSDYMGMFALFLTLFAAVKYFSKSRKERNEDHYTPFISSQVNA
jgi:hypothetical protein